MLALVYVFLLTECLSLYRLVVLERKTGGINGDANGLARHRLLQRRLVVGRHIHEVVYGHNLLIHLQLKKTQIKSISIIIISSDQIAI